MIAQVGQGEGRVAAEEVRAALSFLDIDLEESELPATLEDLGELLLHPDNTRSSPLTQGIMRLSTEIMKTSPEFIRHISAVMLNNLKLARQYVPGMVNHDLLYFHATEMTGNVEGILDRNPASWRPFIGRKMEVHELACHHELVLEPVSAAQIGRVLQRHLAFRMERPLGISSLAHETMESIAPAYG